MGFGGISPWSLLIILVIILLLFGTKRLRNMGTDLGETFKNFKKSVKEDEPETDKPQEQVTQQHQDSGRVIDSEAKEKKKDEV